jgi:hypothetical protein
LGVLSRPLDGRLSGTRQLNPAGPSSLSSQSGRYRRRFVRNPIAAQFSSG